MRQGIIINLSYLPPEVIQASGPHPDNKSCQAGLQPSVQTKNRYKDIVPCKALYATCCTHKDNCIHFHVVDRSRVLLKTMEDSTDEYVNTAAGAGYINASFVDVSDGGIEEAYYDFS